ncbi:hypothetical protein B0H11DRAFT_2002032 [Mycena galericulata]|nr:hypothetical protein B0H11DRAFT_2198949 [Mycena galericulata]KAJ7495642.1 hypothetical protein B0H11DRAFT_2002032 [Mycena galericulata]
MSPPWIDVGQANWNSPTGGEEFPTDLSYQVSPPESAQWLRSSSPVGVYGFNSWELPQLQQPSGVIGFGSVSLDRGSSMQSLDLDLMDWQSGLDVSVGTGYIPDSSSFRNGAQVYSRSSSLFRELLEKELTRKGAKLLSTVDCGLWAIEDSPSAKRPAPFPLLLKLVIYASPTRSSSLGEIYAEFRDRFPWCNEEDVTWKDSIRHCLSRDQAFVNIERHPHTVGRSGRWGLSMLIHQSPRSTPDEAQRRRSRTRGERKRRRTRGCAEYEL